jgi:SPP1 family predicted phage head-tail adaptor
MRAGRLRKRLVLQSKTEARDAYGGTVITWTDEATVWGAIEPLSGREYFSQQAVQAESKVRIVLRYYAGISTSWRVSHGGLFYNIEDVLNHDTRNRQITLMCREGVSDDEATVSSYLLLESGDQLLLESSGSLVLE